ncbi:MAG: alkaline phosphatase family protein [Candidatus Polarisedimenticolia bacterium]
MQKGWQAGRALLAALLMMMAACRDAGQALPTAPGRPGPKILLIGLDAADWQIAGPLADQGRLPNLNGLRERGAWGTVRSMVPVLSPLLWTSVATGATADQHGVIDFLVPDPETGRKTPVQSSARRMPALWDHFTAASRTSDVVAWWATWPAEPLRGRLVSDRVAYSLFGVAPPESGTGLTWPADLLGEIRPDFVDEQDVTYEDVRRFMDVSPEVFAAARAGLIEKKPDAQRHPVGHFIRILASTRTYHGIALRLLRSGQADFTAVYYQGIDEVCHRFIHFAPPALEGIDPADVRRYGRAVESFYLYQDQLLGELLAAADPGSIVVVLSDHGFVNGPDRPGGRTADIEGQPARWHRRYGVIALAGPAIRPQRLDTSSLLDVAPTLLYLAGMPIPDTMSGRVLTGAIEPAHLASFPERRVPAGEIPITRQAGPAAAGHDEEGSGSEEMMATLRSLGYIGSGSSSVRASPGTGTVTAHANLAGVLMAAGNLAEAEKEIQAALRLAPAAPQGRLMLFDLRMRQRRWADALSVGEGLLEGDPDLLGDLFLARLASAYREAGELPRGTARLQADVAGGRWQLGCALARLHKEAGRLDDAEAAARAVLSRNPLDESAMGVLVSLAQAHGSIASLEGAIGEALRRNPRSLMHLNWMALAARERGDTTRAVLLLEAASDVNPDHPATLANLGAVHLAAGRADLAVPVLVRAVDLNPASTEARVNLGTAWAVRGRYREAIEQFEWVWKSGHQTEAIARALARAWGESGHADAARHWQQVATKIN